MTNSGAAGDCPAETCENYGAQHFLGRERDTELVKYLLELKAFLVILVTQTCQIACQNEHRNGRGTKHVLCS